MIHRMHWQIIRRLLLIGAAVFLTQACAVRRAPSGGPADKAPPRVIRTFPAADSTNVTSLNFIEIDFDEGIDRNSVRDQVWMLPEMPNGFEIEWKGNKKMRVALNDSLDENQTYILTVGTEIKDFHGNRLSAPILLTFSSGPTIDHGEISGRIVGEKSVGAYIYAYPLTDDFSAKTIFEQKPRYYTQVSKTGKYQIKYLRPGDYRVYALLDENRDRLYTLQTDQIGIPAKDVLLDSANLSVSNINFTLTREDSSAPKILRARAMRENLVEIYFSEPVKLAQTFHIAIVDSAQKKQLKVLAKTIDPKESTRLFIFTEPQKNTRYLGGIDSVQDVSGNVAAERKLLRFRFTGKPQPDTLKTRLISINPRDGEKNIRYEAPIVFDFSQPVDSASLRANFQLQSADSQIVPGKWRFYSRLQPKFEPTRSFEKGAIYTIRLDLRKIRSVFEIPFGDSLIVSHFTTYEFSELGEISGTVRAGRADWEQAIIEAKALRGDERYSVITPVNVPYQLVFLPDGFYHLKAMIDVNKNGKYDAGQSDPFQFAEPFLLYRDTVKVRKRWTSDGIDFDFGK